jgi:hypothetical protein
MRSVRRMLAPLASSTIAALPCTACGHRIGNCPASLYANPSLEETMAPAAGPVGTAASKLVGATVENANGDNVGEIPDVRLSSEGNAEALVVDVGGFLGMERAYRSDEVDRRQRSDGQ